jgi:aldehyde:ferredoxin oxidoreductase
MAFSVEGMAGGEEKMSHEWFGWSGKILRINLTKRKVTKQELPKERARNYIGGRGINVKILYDEVKPRTDPLGPENLLIFGTGPLEGTPIGMRRVSITAKSLRGCIAEGGFGGFFGPEIKFTGYDHIIIEGIAKKPVYIWIDDDEVEIKDAAHLWGKTTVETEDLIKRDVGDRDVQVACIGPAGENLVPCPVFTDRGKASGGRLDCGTIMGSKKLKAIAVRGSGGVKIARPEEFEKALMKVYEILNVEKSMDPYFTPWFLFGSPMLIRVFKGSIGLHSYNCKTLYFDYADDLSGEKFLEKYVVRRGSCFCCVAPCKFWYEIRDGPYAGTKGGYIQAGSLMALGPLVGLKISLQ